MVFRVALLQYPIYWTDKDKNLCLTEERIAHLAGKADVAVLPEMFTTGFCMDRPELAEPSDGPTILRLQQLADKHDIAVIGSFICSEDDHLYNRGFFVAPRQRPVFIDKAHLYSHGGEDRFFIAGRQRTVITYKGVKIRLLLCYDLRFPVWARQDKNNMYDLLLVSANWPECRIAYWDALLAARGIENQCYIAGVNPVGDDGMNLHYNGHSVAYDTHLHPLVAFQDNEEGTKVAAFDIDSLHHFRETLPLWKDGDEFYFERPEK